MSDSRLSYRPREDATPEGELTALTSVYAFVLQRHYERATETEGGEDEEAAERDRTGGIGSEKRES